MTIELALLILLGLYALHLKIQSSLNHKVIQAYQQSAIILPKPEKKRDLGSPALLLAALALLTALASAAH
jgi:hypothetical protein